MIIIMLTSKILLLCHGFTAMLALAMSVNSYCLSAPVNRVQSTV